MNVLTVLPIYVIHVRLLARTFYDINKNDWTRLERHIFMNLSHFSQLGCVTTIIKTDIHILKVII